MRYTIDIPNDGKRPVELIKPESTSVIEDLLALGFFMKCSYDNLDTDEEREAYLRGLKKITNPELFKKSRTVKS